MSTGTLYKHIAQQEASPSATSVFEESRIRDGQESRARRAIFLMAAITVVFLASPFSRFLIYIFPAMACGVGLYTSRRSVRIYMGFVTYLWILTPLVRRLVDFRAGWIPATAVHLAPFLATAVPLAEVLQSLPRLGRRHSAAFVFIPAACLYGCAVGFAHFHLSDIFHDLLLWVAPFVVMLFVFLRRAQFSEMYRGVESAMVIGLLLAGLYGLVQFFFLPEWDALWMQEVDLDSIGLPEPTLVRVFSVMNSPQVLASYIGAGLLFAFGSNSKLRFAAIPVGLLTLVLSLARSGWLSLVVGLLYLMFFLPVRQRVILILISVFSAATFLVALQNFYFHKAMTERFETLTDIGHDDSYLDRTEGYRAVFQGLLENPFGLGMGTATVQQQDMTVALSKGGRSVAMNDSAIVTTVTAMGVLGSLLFWSAIVMLVKSCFWGRAVQTPIRILRAVLVALFAEALLTTIFVGPTGYLTWLCIGLLLAQRTAAAEESVRSAYSIESDEPESTSLLTSEAL
jgi:hypothetical protein